MMAVLIFVGLAMVSQINSTSVEHGKKPLSPVQLRVSKGLGSRSYNTLRISVVTGARDAPPSGFDFDLRPKLQGLAPLILRVSTRKSSAHGNATPMALSTELKNSQYIYGMLCGQQGHYTSTIKRMQRIPSLASAAGLSSAN